MAQTDAKNVSVAKRFFLSIAFATLAYVVCATIIFGSVLSPFGIVLFWNDRLEPQFWYGPAIGGFVLGGAVAAFLWSKPSSRIYAPAAFLAVSMTFAVAATVIAVDIARKNLVTEFEPNQVFQHSLWRSLHEAPREFQTYLHAAALRDCVPYAWSYRQMAFYRLPANVAVNVLPSDWIETCKIKRE